MNRLRVFLAFNAVLWALSIMPGLFPGCTGFDQEKEKVAIVVGSRQITIEELKEDIVLMCAGMNISVLGDDKLKDEFLERLIDQYLIMEYGRENGISTSEQELNNALRDIRSEYTENAFQDVLLRGYVDYEQWENQLREQLLINKIIKKVTGSIPPPSYQDIKQYFDANQDEFRTLEMLRFRQIVTRTKEESENLLKRLHDGEDMSELAKKHSIGPEAENGGEVSWVVRSHLDESMENGLFLVPHGEISPVIETPYGYHIFKVLSVRSEGVRGLPEAISEIESKLYNQKREVFYKNWLGKLRSHFEVSVNQDLLNSLEFS
ncbi:MAG: peptidyl-prolyl cis-trans isomerase [Thermodesulfobacteriota bacterium]|nr:peptidyl-prolyl cis-trans isomerase [Thermodesulfobacteriota bacterium]